MSQSPDNDSAIDEATPFIAHEPPEPRRQRPPKLQLAILFLIQSCENVTAIDPFVNQLVRSTGITGGDEKRTGYFVGIMESLFFISEGTTAVLWQIASDRFGRRPLLLLAPLGLGITAITFGLAETFAGLIVSRTIQGTFNGDVGVTKTALAEHTDSSNRAEVMALVPVYLTIGSSLAPFIGGIFSEPAQHWPNSFGKIKLLQDRPYLLPCLVSGLICLGVFSLARLELDETHPHFRGRKAGTNMRTTNGPRSRRSSQGFQTFRVQISKLLTREVVLVLLISSFYAICFISVKSLQALIWSTSIANGGLGFDALTIGSINTIMGFIVAFLLFFFLGKLMRRLGAKIAMLSYFIFSLFALLLYPLQTYLARRGDGVGLGMWFVIILQFFCMKSRSLGYASLLIYAAEVSPNPGSMGMVQGLVQTTGVLMKGIGPALSLPLFAYTIETNAWGGSLVYIILGAIHLGAIGVTLFLPAV
ncbi:major facilitator superfamily domain-containing protein [Flagelloscypha sp. PMI_526]|nr:major facilitator superfamily domain-containing protein [Flagelloscypha sp. PMI_526]